MNDYPIFLDLCGKRWLVVGGGEIGARKVTAAERECERHCDNRP
jgi:siroheme synthase (precorrin-2 oxidase/ferrochelatase)